MQVHCKASYELERQAYARRQAGLSPDQWMLQLMVGAVDRSCDKQQVILTTHFLGCAACSVHDTLLSEYARQCASSSKLVCAFMITTAVLRAPAAASGC